VNVSGTLNGLAAPQGLPPLVQPELLGSAMTGVDDVVLKVWVDTHAVPKLALPQVYCTVLHATEGAVAGDPQIAKSLVACTVIWPPLKVRA